MSKPSESARLLRQIPSFIVTVFISISCGRYGLSILSVCLPCLLPLPFWARQCLAHLWLPHANQGTAERTNFYPSPGSWSARHQGIDALDLWCFVCYRSGSRSRQRNQQRRWARDHLHASRRIINFHSFNLCM